ncbi:hypothetical protein [Chryseobacterium gambrini]|uniref:hypothetical protein n=1 Tax=Chryseobacterium gambrini TaxID=373672 RepID=UPI003D0A80CE
MGKRDLTITQETNNPNSITSKKKDREKAIANLEKAKKLNRPVIYLKSGEGEFSKKNENKEEKLLNSKAAADYIGISYCVFSRRYKKARIPTVKKGSANFFRITDLEKFKDKITNVQQHD